MIALNPCNVEFDDATHTYMMDGKELSGVTSLIHAYTGLCVPDKTNDYVLNSIVPKAGARGEATHRAIQELEEKGIRHDTMDITWHTGQWDNGRINENIFTYANTDTFDVREPLASYEVMHKGMKTIACEHLVQFGNYASAIDNVSKDNVLYGVYLIDYKTNNLKYLKGGKQELIDYLSWQLGFYKFALQQANPDLEILGCYGFWLRDDKYERWTINPVSEEAIRKMLETKWEKVGGKFYYYKDTDFGRVYYGEVSPEYNEF